MVKQLKESYTEFSVDNNYGSTDGSWSRMWKKFSATVFRRREQNPFSNLNTKEVHPLQGDIAITDEPTAPSNVSHLRHGISLPVIEQQRRRRYRDYEDMDTYPEIAVALDMYADDSTIPNESGEIIHIRTKYDSISEEIKKFFSKVKLNKFIWDIVRNTAKYGDNFIENIAYPDKPKLGIRRLKILNPNFLLRKEDEHGILKSFEQMIPSKTGYYNNAINQKNAIPLDKNQIVHFRIRNSDATFIPYGKSIMAAGTRIYKQLRLMEDAMFIYRVQRAPERRVFYLDIENLPPHKARMYIEEIKKTLHKESYFDVNKKEINERFNPMGANEDIFLPVRKNSKTNIDILPGASNLGEIDDVKYFRDKILTLMKIPPDYLSYTSREATSSNQGSLREKDVKYGRAVKRLQKQVCFGLETLVKRHLTLRGYPVMFINSFELYFTDPCLAEEKQLLELNESKARAVQAFKGLEIFPDEWLMKKFFGLEDYEIRDIVALMDKQKEKLREEEALALEEQTEAQEPEPGVDETINGEIADNAEEPVSDTGAEEEKT